MLARLAAAALADENSLANAVVSAVIKDADTTPVTTLLAAVANPGAMVKNDRVAAVQYATKALPKMVAACAGVVGTEPTDGVQTLRADWNAD